MGSSVVGSTHSEMGSQSGLVSLRIWAYRARVHMDQPWKQTLQNRTSEGRQRLFFTPFSRGFC